jgi:hypothetical protein
MQTSSSSYIGFDTSSNTSVVNIDNVNTIPGVSSTPNYTFASNELQLSSTFSGVAKTRSALCLNPSIKVGGLQTFVAFKIPSAMPQDTAVEVWLNDVVGKNSIYVSIKNTTAQGLIFEVNTGVGTDDTPISLPLNTELVLLIYIDASGTFITAQVVDLVRLNTLRLTVIVEQST